MKKSDGSSQERRDFIAKCGRFALVTPPAIALLLSADGRSYAAAFSGGNNNGNNNNNQGQNNNNQN